MGRFRRAGSTGHHITCLGPNTYRISWGIDRYYPGSRLRHPQHHSRITDKVGAKRFAKKWGLPMDTGGPDSTP